MRTLSRAASRIKNCLELDTLFEQSEPVIGVRPLRREGSFLDRLTAAYPEHVSP